MSDIGHFEPDDLRRIPTFRAYYSDRTALLMAKLAFLAYEPFDADAEAFGRFSEAFRAMGLIDCVSLIDADVGTAGYVVANDAIIVIAFRGTQDELDWMTNVRLRFVTLQGGTRVHTGFFQAYWPIRDALFAEVERLLAAKPRPLYVTGHSLGGALACMATAELANHERADVRDSMAACYTFGCPRVGDASFDVYVKVPLYRVTNGVDIVPAVPPAIFGYRHVGDTRYFGKIGAAPSRRSPNIFLKAWRTFTGLLRFFPTLKLANLSDHGMSTYIAKLARWLKETTQEMQDVREKTADPEIAVTS
jgi:triacylglycerol lipase